MAILETPLSPIPGAAPHDDARTANRTVATHLLGASKAVQEQLDGAHRQSRLAFSATAPLGLVSAVCGTSLPHSSGLGASGSQTLSAIIRNGAVDNGATIDAFPSIKYEKEIRKPLQHHHAFTLRTIHRSLPG
ncbi:MAG: hypothetical protein IPM58_05475 [Nitrospira sp.]|nr:hypothetical protein [Nitrospira sp.]